MQVCLLLSGIISIKYNINFILTCKVNFKFESMPQRLNLSIVESEPEIYTFIPNLTLHSCNYLLLKLDLLPFLLLVFLVFFNHQRVLSDHLSNQPTPSKAWVFNANLEFRQSLFRLYYQLLGAFVVMKQLEFSCLGLVKVSSGTLLT